MGTWGWQLHDKNYDNEITLSCAHYMISHSEKIKLDDRLFSSVSVKAGP